MTPEVLAKSAHLFDVRPAMAFKMKAGTPPATNEFVGMNPPYGAVLQYYLKALPAQPMSIVVLDALTGKRVASPRLAVKTGLNQVVWNLRADGTEAIVPPGEYLAILQMGDQKQYKMIQVEAD